MKALTVCQPYADLICLPDDDDRAKRVENRRWPTHYRGPLLIHAGKSREWLASGDYGLDVAGMVFGAIVGVAKLVDCFRLLDSQCLRWSGQAIPEYSLRHHPWLAGHQHVEGPFCFVLTECRRFAEPIPYRGAQGFFDVPAELVANALEAAG